MSFEDSLTWVHKDFLVFGGKPGRGFELEQDLDVLRSRKIGSILSLVEVETNLPVYRKSGFYAEHVPVPDLHAPTPSQFETCIAFLSEMRSGNIPVYVHCLAGYGRSATIAAAWLIRRGSTAEEAIRTIRRLKAGTIESEEQYNALIEYAVRVQLHDKIDS